MMRWLDAYETGAGAVAQQQVQAFSSKKFKSHRRVPEDDGTQLKVPDGTYIWGDCFFLVFQPIGQSKLRFVHSIFLQKLEFSRSNFKTLFY